MNAATKLGGFVVALVDRVPGRRGAPGFNRRLSRRSGVSKGAGS